HENNLDSLPESILKLDSLNNLQIVGNPIHTNPSLKVEHILEELRNMGVKID
ncbi:hypothetical protein LCGC14_1623150, partial [marine sediment metagenome]